MNGLTPIAWWNKLIEDGNPEKADMAKIDVWKVPIY